MSNRKLLTLIIIDDLKRMGNKSSIASPAAGRLLKHEVPAAKFLLKNELI